MPQDPGLAFTENLINRFIQMKSLQFQVDFQRRREGRYERQLQEQSRRFDITQTAMAERHAQTIGLQKEGLALQREGMERRETRLETGMEAETERFDITQGGLERHRAATIRIQEEANLIRGAAAGVATEQSKIALTTTMRKEFASLSKDYRTIVASYERVKASAEDPSAAGDLALIFNYMKMLDPSSVVRESEFATAAASGSLGQRWIAMGKKLLAGERLSPVVRADFVDRSHRLFQSQEGIQTELSKWYGDMAERYDLSPQDIVTEWAPEAPAFQSETLDGDIYENQTATNPNTGERIIFRSGKWQPIE